MKNFQSSRLQRQCPAIGLASHPKRILPASVPRIGSESQQFWPAWSGYGRWRGKWMNQWKNESYNVNIYWCAQEEANYIKRCLCWNQTHSDKGCEMYLFMCVCYSTLSLSLRKINSDPHRDHIPFFLLNSDLKMLINISAKEKDLSQSLTNKC